MPTPLIKENTLYPIAKETITNTILYSFTDALKQCVEGKKITKQSWNNANVYFMFAGNQLSIMKADGNLAPLIVTLEDFRGDDWIVL